MKIVFFGSSPSSLICLKKILEEGHEIPLVITQPDRPSGRGKKIIFSPVKKFALDEGIRILQPEKIRTDEKVLEELKKIKPDLNVVVAYGQLIPSSIIFLPLYKSINLHFSLLPKYRGASPVQWAILNGEETTGVTIFELNEKLDEGDILTQKEVRIFPEETAGELEKRLAEIGAVLLGETMKKIEEIKRQPQDHSRATYAPRLKKEEGKIDWKNEALLIERKVRAFNPWPSAFTFFDKMRIKILKGKRIEGITSSSPGEVVGLEKDGIRVSCGQGSLFLIEVLQAENRKTMNAHSFTLGARIECGMKFN